MLLRSRHALCEMLGKRSKRIGLDRHLRPDEPGLLVDRRSRLLAVILTERGEKVRVVTSYDLDAGQKRDYLTKRLKESKG